MKKPLRFSHYILLLFGCWLNSSLLAAGDASLIPGLTLQESASEASMLVCSTPTNPYTSNVTESTATFIWNSVSGAQSYSVQYRVLGGQWGNAPGSPYNYAWVTIYGLQPCTSFEWRVRANCNNGEYSSWTYPVDFSTTCTSYCEHPTWLYTANITQTSATFDWDPISNAQNYSVQWRYAGGAWYDLSGGPFNNTYVNVNGLQPATNYEWRVRSNCGNGNYSPWSYPEYFTTLGYSCYVPDYPHTTNIGETSATLNWNWVSGAVSYSVEKRLPGGNWTWVQGSPFNGTSVTIYGLNPYTTYEWRVRANCNGGNYSYWTYPVVFTTQGYSYCYAPTWLYTTNITQHSATWSWDAVPGAQSYVLQWRYAGGNWNNLNGGPFYQTWVNVAGLTPGTYYEWRVKTICYNGNWSGYSQAAYFTTLNYSCQQPSSPYTTYITESSATLNWYPVSGAVSYSVQMRQPNGTWQFVQNSPFSGTSTTVNGLYPNTQYEWRVRANCSDGQYSYWTYAVYFITNGGSSYCQPPSWLYTANVGQNSVTFDWSDVNGALSYTVQYRIVGGTWYDVPGSPFYDNWASLNNLQPGTTYEWRVKSNCSNGNMSEWSNTVTFTTQSGFNCYTPSNTYTTNITPTSATFNWSSVSGAVSYSVQTRLPNGNWNDVAGSPFGNTYANVNGLTPNTTYEWRVRANCGNGSYSEWSYPVTFNTGGSSTCDAPGNLDTYNIGQSTATWDWDPANGAVSYYVQWRNAPNGVWHDLPGGPWTLTALAIGGLSPGTSYEWRVRSNCSNGGQSEWSLPEAFTTLPYNNSCNTPANPNTTNITNTTAVFNWSSVSGAVSYSVQTRLPGGIWYYLPGSPFANTTVSADGFTPNTTYEWRVRTNCGNGQYSNWTSPVTFTTTGGGGGNAPANDNCSGATLLTVNTSCVNVATTNVSSTASTPAPVGGCNANFYKDVWFKFVMPDIANPAVTIRTSAGSLIDGVMEVYLGDNCSSLFYLTCEDDNTNGNGSKMPVISVTGNANDTIWVRVWGYGGNTGTFNICVMDFLSNDFTSNPTDLDPAAGEELTVAVVPLTEKEMSSGLHLAPNPVSEELTVSFLQNEKTTVTAIAFTDLSGKMMLKREYQSSDESEFQDRFNVAEWTPGIYVLQVMTTSGIITEKVSVDHR